METNITKINTHKITSKSIRFAIAFCLTFLVSLFSLEAQQLPNDCASTDPCNEPWNGPVRGYVYTETRWGDLMRTDFTFYWRECNGQIQIMIDWSETTVSNLQFFNSGSFFEKDFSGAREYMELDILYYLIESSIIPSIPHCEHGTKTIVNFYTARCGVWVKCSYKVDLNAAVQRDDCYQGDCPNPIPHQGQPYIDVWKWQPCGTTCCKKQYELCFEVEPKYDRYVIRIKNVTRGRAPGFTCSEQGNCHDWRTNQEYQCQDGCEGDGN